jgi:uncharacterized protein YjcR
MQATQKTEQMTRDEAIRKLREKYSSMVDDDNSICKVAAEKGIFCRGFKQYGDSELKHRYDWIDRRHKSMSREELEDIANRWQLARQEVEDAPIACDVQQKVHDTCGGWDDFSNEDLARFWTELTGKAITVV